MKSGNFTVDEIEFKLKQYCSYQDRCHNEVEKKLKTFDVIPEAREQIIIKLINENYLNETRFSKSFVRGKFKIKNWGKRKIILELKSRNVSSYNIKEGLKEIANLYSDIVVASIVGLAGLDPLLCSIKNSSVIALANKECIVAAGSLITESAKKNNCQIIPVDSEHNAIFQILDGKLKKDINEIFLTASGGPFHGFSEEQLTKVSPADAVRHPIWNMGKKISVDSATLMNKGLEIIEAHHLFGIENKKIRVIIHKQSIIHGLTLMNNGALFGYFGKPSMLNPIDHALSWPDCKNNNIDPISIEDLNGLSVENALDEDYKSLKLSRYALDRGGFYPIFLNASNEIAVKAFLSGQIKFIDIPLVIEKVIEEIGHSGNKSLETMSGLEEIILADNEARVKALEIIGLGF